MKKLLILTVLSVFLFTACATQKTCCTKKETTKTCTKTEKDCCKKK